MILSLCPNYGGKIFKILTEAKYPVSEATLYKALHRMEARGWLTSEWDLSEAPRKHYELTYAGMVARLNLYSTYQAMIRAVEKVTRHGIIKKEYRS